MILYRRWIIRLFSLTAVPLLTVALFNYFMDPLWCFSLTHSWNSAQLDLNDRQQKTNALVFQKPEFDSILLGSSISTFINHNDFKGMKLYNYASPLMRPWEYAGFVANARKAGGKDLKNIIIGIDFFGSNKAFSSFFEQPAKYYETANSFFYRYKMLFNIKTFDFSKRNLEQAGKASRAVYSRDYVRTLPQLGARKLTVEGQQIPGYDKNYKYENDIKNMLTRLKEENKASHVTFFLTPLSKPLYCYIVKEGFLPSYERWIRDLVAVNGEVYNFMYVNSITVDDANFFDIGHFYPKIGTLIARKVTGEDNGTSDFGILVTQDNLDDHLRFIRENSKACSSPTPAIAAD